MILAIDSGNTHTTVGCIKENERDICVFRIPTDRAETEFGYAVKIRQILQLFQISEADLTGAIISCVVPPLTGVLVKAVRLLADLEPLVVGAGVKTGLHIRINDPGTVAADLVSAAVAAKELYPLPCAVVDMGTATTLTVIDTDGKYIGGMILPGVGLSLDALSEGTALLPKIEIVPPKSAIGANTVDCMKAGIVYGAAGAVDGILDRTAEALGCEPASIVATGGLASSIVPHCKHAITLDDTLILKGLKLIWERNQK